MSVATEPHKAKPHPIYVLVIMASLLISLIATVGPLFKIGQPFAGFRFEPTLTYSAVNESYWTGPKAGFKEYDRITQANGQTVKTPDELNAIVREVGVGNPITYTVQRKVEKDHQVAWEEKTLTVAVMEFSLKDYFASFFTLFLVGIAHLLIGAIAYLMKPDSVAGKAHWWMTMAIGLTTTLVGDYDLTMWFPRVWILMVALSGSACLHLALVFPYAKKHVQKRPWLQYWPYVPGGILAILWQMSFHAQGLAGVGPEALQMHFDLYDMSLAWSILVGFLGLIGIMIHSLVKAPTYLLKQQAKVGLIGAAVAYLPMVFLWVIPAIILGTPLDSSGALVMILWLLFVTFPLSVAYAVVKHQLFDITVVLKQGLVYSSLVFILGGGYFAVTSALRAAMGGSGVSDTPSLLMTGVVAIAFDPLRARIRRFIDERFFRAPYDAQQVLASYTAAVRSTLNKDKLVATLSDTLDKTFHPTGLTLRLADHHTGNLETAELVLPLTVGEEVQGELLLGPKKSEIPYTEADRRLLQGLLVPFALAYHGAGLAEEVADAEVVKRTLEKARLIQKSMLPSQELAINSVQMAGYSESADETGGDYYDWFDLGEGRFSVAVGDVTGHGIDAALVVAMAESALYLQTGIDSAPARVLSALNGTLHNLDSHRLPGQEKKLMTFVHALFADQTVHLASAGHFYPYIFRAASGQVEELTELKSTFPLGVRPPDKFKVTGGEVPYQTGDVFVFFTDGVHEAHSPDGQEYGFERLQAMLQKLGHLDAAAIKQGILDDLYGFIQSKKPLEDDVTLVVIKHQ